MPLSALKQSPLASDKSKNALFSCPSCTNWILSCHSIILPSSSLLVNFTLPLSLQLFKYILFVFGRFHKPSPIYFYLCYRFCVTLHFVVFLFIQILFLMADIEYFYCSIITSWNYTFLWNAVDWVKLFLFWIYFLCRSPVSLVPNEYITILRCRSQCRWSITNNWTLTPRRIVVIKRSHCMNRASMIFQLPL